MKKFERIISFILLAILSLSNVGTPVAYAAQAKLIHLKLDHTSPLDATGLTSVPRFYLADNSRSVLGASTSLFTVGTQKLDLDAGNNASAHQRIPVRVAK